MTELTCQQCREIAAELAINVITGTERAQALAHLDSCPACRDTVSALTVTVDRLVELIPETQPPPGFEHRVIAALTPAAPRLRRWRTPAAAILVASALTVGGSILDHTNHGATPADAQAGERTVMYAPLTTTEQHSEQHQIGHAYIYPGNPSWIYLSLDTKSNTTSDSVDTHSNATSDTVQCEVVRQDGSAVPVATFSLTHGRGAWGGPAPVDRDTLISARLINGNGHTLATAHFTPPSKKTDHPTPQSHAEPRRHGHS